MAAAGAHVESAVKNKKRKQTAASASEKNGRAPDAIAKKHTSVRSDETLAGKRCADLECCVACKTCTEMNRCNFGRRSVSAVMVAVEEWRRKRIH